MKEETLEVGIHGVMYTIFPALSVRQLVGFGSVEWNVATESVVRPKV